MDDDERAALLACRGKASYMSRKGARDAISRLRKKPHYQAPEGKRLNAYRCPLCGAWHIGHTNR